MNSTPPTTAECILMMLAEDPAQCVDDLCLRYRIPGGLRIATERWRYTFDDASTITVVQPRDEDERRWCTGYTDCMCLRNEGHRSACEKGRG